MDTEIKDFVKRVIGLAGERVSAENGVLLVNGKPLEESYLKKDVRTEDFSEIWVPDNHIFVMGDNRPSSRDSRSFGPIHENRLVGEVFVRLWPLNTFGCP